jgi:hypothetical protein
VLLGVQGKVVALLFDTDAGVRAHLQSVDIFKVIEAFQRRLLILLNKFAAQF